MSGASGEPGRNRTFNPRIKSPLLCQLSYGPAPWGERVFTSFSENEKPGADQLDLDGRSGGGLHVVGRDVWSGLYEPKTVLFHRDYREVGDHEVDAGFGREGK